jgi:hypothetical protein
MRESSLARLQIEAHCIYSAHANHTRQFPPPAARPHRCRCRGSSKPARSNEDMGMFRRRQLTTSSPKGTQVHPISLLPLTSEV